VTLKVEAVPPLDDIKTVPPVVDRVPLAPTETVPAPVAEILPKERLWVREIPKACPTENRSPFEINKTMVHFKGIKKCYLAFEWLSTKRKCPVVFGDRA